MAQGTSKPKLDPRLALRLTTKKAELDQYRPLPPNIVRHLYEDLRVLLTYHSNAIEGNSLSLWETQLVIENGITAGGKPLKDYLEATNHAQAYAHLQRMVEGKERFTYRTILDLHRLVMQQIDEKAGTFRTTQVYIRGANFMPPSAREVPELIGQWLGWLEGAGLEYEPLIRAAIAHHDFEAIHPFLDGNGRTGRLLLNLMLMQNGYPPALLLRNWRGNYLAALDSAGRGNYNPICNLTGRAVEGGLDLYLEVCKKEPEDLYQPLSILAKQSGLSADYLGWLVRKGRLAAVKRQGRWYSTPAALKAYQESVTEGVAPRGRPKQAKFE
jgi:Fic family protein